MVGSSAKADILTSIRRNLVAGARSNDLLFLEPANPELHRTTPILSDSSVVEQRALVDIFCENLAAVGGEFSIVNRLDEAASKLTAILDEIRPRRIAISDSPKVRALVEAVQNEAEICERASSAELFDCDIGITEAQWAIAETGTLVLESEKEYSRLTSLVPETHICLLPAANIRSTMSDILQVLEIGIEPVVTFITGPSRTSDIELTLAIGVHGPRQLIVIVIGDEV